jgi:hypothetical protein
MRWIYAIHLEMVSCGMIYIPSFMKISRGLQAILRFCLSNFKGCNVGIIDGWIDEVRCLHGFTCHDIRNNFPEDWFRHKKIDERDI